MRLTFAGNLALQLEDEWLFEGRAVPVMLKAEVPPEEVSFENGKARINVDVPIDLKISEREWSRAVGEVIARMFRRSPIVGGQEEVA